MDYSDIIEKELSVRLKNVDIVVEKTYKYIYTVYVENTIYEYAKYRDHIVYNSEINYIELVQRIRKQLGDVSYGK